MTERADIEHLIDRMFAGDDAKPEEVVVVASALGSDEDARAYYGQVARVDAELGGDFEARFGEAWFLAGLDEMLAEEQAANAQPSELAPGLVAANTNRPVQMWAAIAALVMFSFAGVLTRTAQTDEFQARSAVQPVAKKYESPELAVFCVERDGESVRFRGADDFEFGTVRCPRDAEIKLAARSLDDRLRWGSFFGVASDGTIYWYGPSPASPTAVAVEVAPRIRPLGETIRLGVNHARGTVRVVGIFSENPLDWPSVEKIARRNVASLRDGALEIENAMVVRKTFEVDGR